MKKIFNLLILLPLLACQQGEEQTPSDQLPPAQPPDEEFSQYWYQGEAEINVFELEQARYGQIRKGYAVQVYVTEPFLTDKQVKADKPDGQNEASVMKLNYIKKFPTGIYDYSMMTSVFTPVLLERFPHSLKVASSTQEWCGMTYLQLNLRQNQYEITGHSYFEDEVEEDYKIGTELLEDEVWNIIRIDPLQLPEGQLNVIPSAMSARLRHLRMKPEAAETALSPYMGNSYPGKDLMVYTLEFKESFRTKKIFFEAAFPHRIAGWEETYKDGFGNQQKELITRGTRVSITRNAYWTLNDSASVSLRDSMLIDSLSVW